MASKPMVGVTKTDNQSNPWRFRKAIDGIRISKHFSSLKKANEFAKSFTPQLHAKLACKR